MSDSVDPGSETAPLPDSKGNPLHGETLPSDSISQSERARPPSWKDRLRQRLRDHEHERGDAAEGVSIPIHATRFRPIRELGRGGMGAVFEAEDTVLQRRVALKVLLDGEFATPHALERFEIEARAAARLRHPNIVGVLEVGEERGQRYLVMDLIEGDSLAGTLKSGGPLAAHEAAGIALSLAKALAYAHSHAILHRDVKPANVLLTSEGEPMLTDFGLAKDVEKSQNVTASGHAMGTPAYMPPEQAEGDQERIDRRSDVYSLGATLYEMLVGRPPFTAQNIVSLLRKVLDQEPVAPSRVVPDRDVDPDLETICLKCLEKEPERRYGSAGELAADLERYLKSEPILARRASLLERIGKWRRRNNAVARTLAISIGLAALVILSGTALFLRRLKRERDLARVAALEARDALEMFVFEVRERLGDLDSPKAREARNLLLASAVKRQLRLRELEKATGFAPTTIQGPAAFRDIGDLALEAGRTEVAREAYLQALELSKELYERSPDDELIARNLAVSIMKMGRIQRLSGDSAAARKNYEGALALLRTLPEERAEVARELALALIELGDVFRDQGDDAKAMGAFRESLACSRALLEGNPDEVEFLRALGLAVDRCGDLLRESNEPVKARAYFEEGLRVSRRLVKLDPGKANRRDLYVSCTRMGDLLLSAEDEEGARKAYDEALVLARQFYEADPTNARGRRDLAYCLQQLGWLHYVSGDPTEARAAFEESLELARSLRRMDPTNADTRRGLSTILDRFGDFLRETSKLGDAKLLYTEALGIARELADANPDSATAQRDLGVSLLNVGDVHRLQGQLTEAEAIFGEGLKRARALVAKTGSKGARDDLATILSRLARVRGNRGKVEEAIGLFKESLRIHDELLAEDPKSFADARHKSATLEALGELFHAIARYEEALARQQDAIALLRELRVRDPASLDIVRRLSSCLIKASDALRLLRRVDEARPVCEEGIALQRRVNTKLDSNEARRDLAVALSSLAVLQDDPAKVLEIHQEVVGIHRALLEEDPSNASRAHDLAVSLSRLAMHHQGLRDVPAAIDAWSQAVAVLRATAERNPESEIAAEDLASFLSRLAAIQMDSGRVKEAAESYGEALRIVRPLGRERSAPRTTLLACLLRMGSLHFRAGDLDGARRYWTEGLEVARDRLKREPEAETARRDLSIALMKIFNLHRVTGDLPAALKITEEVVANHTALVEEHPRFAPELEQFKQIYAATRDHHDLMAGKRPPRSAKERLDVAYYYFREAPDPKRALAGFRAALQDADTAADPMHVYNAACAAGRVLAGKDDPALHLQALAWLKQSLALRREALVGLEGDALTLAKGDLAKHLVRARDQDPDFAALRSDPAFTKLFDEK